MDTNTEIQTDQAEVPAPEPTPLFDYRGNGKVARLPKIYHYKCLVDSAARAWQGHPMLGETENQFSFTRAALSKGRRLKSKRSSV